MRKAWLITLGAAWMMQMGPPAAGHPVFATSSVVNAASYQPPELPGGAIARGSIFSIFGRAVGPRSSVQATAFPLSRSLGGVTITVSRAGFPDLPAIPLFVSESQINAIMPSNAPVGRATLRVRYDDGDGNPSSLPVEVAIVAANPGLFTANASGRGPAIANNFNSVTEQPLNSTETSAAPGQVVTLWATGLGGIAGADDQRPSAVGGVADMQAQSGLSVFVGGARRGSSLRRPQPGVRRPRSDRGRDSRRRPRGCYAPVWFRVAGGLVSNVASLSIRAGGGRCDDRLTPHLAPGADRVGMALLSRVLFEAAPRRT